MVAVLATGDVAEALSVAVSVNVTEPPTGMLTSSLMAVTPLEVAHDAPPVAAHSHVTPLSSAGGMSVTVAPTMSEGPPFAATI